MIFDMFRKIGRRPAPQVRASGYGTSFAKKSLVNWIVTGRSADEDIVENLQGLRARSRDLFMTVPLATGALKTIRTNVVGSGLMLNAQPDREFLGLTEEQATEWERNVEREWALWSGSVNCDASHRCTFYQFQALALLSALMSGDCFVALPYINRPGFPYRLALHLIESDQVCQPTLAAHDKNIFEGIEIGQYGEPVAYYVAKHHPGNWHRKPNESMQEWKRVPAFSGPHGRRNILHLYHDTERPGQRRGSPLLSPVLEAFKQLGRYTDAELVAAVISGYFAVFIKSMNPDVGMPSLGDLGDVGDISRMTPDYSDIELAPGMISSLNPGDDITSVNPGRPNTAFDGFVTAICRQIGAALEIPYELLVKNFTASYSASRASLLEAWKMFRMRRQWLADGLCQPVYEAFLEDAISLGRIKAPGFFDDYAVRKAWARAEWSGDSQGQLDPQKEAAAAKIRVDECFSTREREAAELTGMAYDTIVAQRVREEERRKDLPKAEPRQVFGRPVQPQEPPQEQETGQDEN